MNCRSPLLMEAGVDRQNLPIGRTVSSGSEQLKVRLTRLSEGDFGGRRVIADLKDERLGDAVADGVWDVAVYTIRSSVQE